MNQKIMGKLIKIEREKQSLSLDTFSTLLGVEKITIRKIESGERLLLGGFI